MDILNAFLGRYQGILGMGLDVSKRSLRFSKTGNMPSLVTPETAQSWIQGSRLHLSV